MNLINHLKNAKAYFRKGSFAIIKAKTTHPEAFANIIDDDEITVIIDQTKMNEVDIIQSETNWKILTLDVVLSMDVVGILAKISTSLAEKNVPIMSVSAYSRDHFLIKEKDIHAAIEALTALGIEFQ